MSEVGGIFLVETMLKVPILNTVWLSWRQPQLIQIYMYENYNPV